MRSRNDIPELKAQIGGLAVADAYEQRVAFLQQEMKVLAVTVADAMKEHQENNDTRLSVMERKLQLIKDTHGQSMSELLEREAEEEESSSESTRI